MKIGIIGASAAGLYAAILLAKRHPDFRIDVIEKNDKVGKKLLATGNGHCNLFNVGFSGKAFNHPEFVEKLLGRFPTTKLLDELKGLGIATTEREGLVYPLSFSAAAHVRYLVGLAEWLGIKFHLSERVVSVDGTKIETDRGSYSFDKLIYAFGGCSQANLGSDGSLFPLLQKRGYQIVKTEPSLCPLLSHDVPKSLFGVRHKCELKLTKDKRVLYQENGEVLFKKDGLSGIAIMNASARYERDSVAELDLFPELEENELQKLLASSYRENPADFLSPILEKPLAEFVLQKCNISRKNTLSSSDFSVICKFLKSMQFRMEGKCGFDSSQVTRGGIDLSNIDENLESKIEIGVSFAGECLDIDGLCGGFNLGWALLSSLVVAESL